MKILQFKSQYLSTNCYLIIENNHGIIIDPCHTDEVVNAIANTDTQLDFALITHEHADHIAGVSWVQEYYHIPVVCSEKCAINLGNTRMNYSKYFDVIKKVMTIFEADENVKMEPFVCSADKIFSEDTYYDWNEHQLLLKITPGHSEGSICLLIDKCFLFSGDLLFENQDTITRFKGGSTADFINITKPWLLTLPPSTIVYPGHFESFPIQKWAERERNKENG